MNLRWIIKSNSFVLLLLGIERIAIRFFVINVEKEMHDERNLFISRMNEVFIR